MKVLRILLPAVFFILYLATLHPTVSPYRDSGDMAASAVTLGIAHPPGYPLYTLLGKAWLTLIPFGDAAYRLNVLSALCGFMTLGLLFLLGERWSGSRLAGSAAVLFVGFAPAHWALAQVSEMYALNALLAAAVLCLWPWAGRGASRLLLSACAFLAGLALGNHQTLVLLMPAALWVFWSQRGHDPDLGGWATAGAFFLLGLGVYLFLPLRSFGGAWIDWGEPHGLREFFRVMTRADYGGMRLHPEKPFTLGMGQVKDSLTVNWLAFSRQAGLLGLAACLFGLWARRKESWAQGCFLGFLFSGPFFIFLSNLSPESTETFPILEPHLVLPLVCLAPLFGAGVLSVHARVQKNPALAWTAAALLLLAPPINAMMSGASRDNRHNYAAYDYEKNLLSAMEPGSLLMDPDDPTAFTLSYLKAARRFREDVVPLLYFRTRWGYRQLQRRYPELVASSSIQSGHEMYSYLLRYNLAQNRPIYADLPQKVLPPYRSFPQGWAYRVLEQGRSGDPAVLYGRSVALWELSRARKVTQGDFFTVHAYDYGASAMNNLGVQALNDGKTDFAERCFKRSLLLEPDLDQAWSNWGNVFFVKRDFKKSAACYRAALSLKPLPEYRYNLGRALAADGDKAGAESEWLSALQGADLPDIANDLALLWMERGENERAAEGFSKTLREHPGYRPALYNLGLAWDRMGREDDALRAFKAYRDASISAADRADAEAWIRKIGSKRGAAHPRR